MPVISVDSGWLNRLLGQDYPPDELGDALDQIGCDVEDVLEMERYRCPGCGAMAEAAAGAEVPRSCTFCGLASEEPFQPAGGITAIRLDLLAARPDLFDVGGLTRALKGYLGQVTGLPEFPVEPGQLTVTVDPSVRSSESYRPYISCAVVEMPPLDEAGLVAVMKLQENLHWGVGRDRKLASIGVYDLDHLEGEIRYETLDPDGEPFEPLGMPGRPMTGRKILSDHPKGAAYAHLLADLRRYPVLRDARGRVLSMPPIINSDATKLRTGSRNLFIDVTGISQAAVIKSLDTLVCSLMELGGHTRTVRILDPDGERRTPDLTPRTLEIRLSEAKRWLGLPLDPDSLTASLLRMRVGVEPRDDEGEQFRVTYPAFRTDIKHMVDVFEDVAIGFGYGNIQERAVKEFTVGLPRPEELLSEMARSVMLGLGFREMMSLPLTTEEDHFTRLRMEVPARYPRIGNPKLKALKVLRTHLMTGVLEALRENRRRPLPIRLFEMDNVALLDEQAETGVGEERRLCLVELGQEAGYASIRACVDALLFELDLEGTYRPVEHPTFVEGRAAEFEAGEITGRLGEIHPEILVRLGLDHPVTLAELKLARVV